MSNQIISNAHFHHIALKASDFNRSLKFYTEGLGFTVFKTWGKDDSRAAMLDMGDGRYVELFAGGKKVEMPENASGNFFHLAIGADCSDAAYERAIQCGAISISAPYDANICGPEGELPLHIAFVAGPDGEVIEFFTIRDK